MKEGQNLPPGRRSFCFFTISPTATLALPSSDRTEYDNKTTVGKSMISCYKLTNDQMELPPQGNWLVNITPIQNLS